MANESRAEIIERLCAAGAAPDLANMYASALLTWQEADRHVADDPLIFKHPKTGAPLKNPYLEIRSAAMRDLLALRQLVPDVGLWGDGEASRRAAVERKIAERLDPTSRVATAIRDELLGRQA